MVKLRFPLDELARMGDQIYERDILPRVTAQVTGRIVAIDVETGAYAIHGDKLTAIHQVLDVRPSAQIWVKRIGFAYVERFGWHVSRPSSRNG
jgi:hypothetical protein